MFSRISYLKKTIFLYAGVIIILFSAFIVVYGISQSNNIRNITDSTLEQLSEKGASQLEGILNEMSEISLGIAGNPTVYSVMKESLFADSEENYFQSHPEEKWTIQKEIVGLCGSYFTGKSFNVITNQYDELSLNIYESNIISKERLRDISWFEELKSKGKSKYIVPVGRDEYGRTSEETFSFVRVIQDEFYQYGVIDVQFEKKFLDDIFLISLQGLDIQTIIIKGENEIFYHTQEAPLSDWRALPALNEVSNQSRFYNNVELDYMEYTIYRVPVTRYEMQVYMLIPRNEYIQPMHETIWTTVIFGIVLLLIILLFVYVVSYHLNKPIRELRDHIEHLDYPDLSLDLDMKQTNNEIMLLTHAFHAMMSRIQNTTSELIESKTREIEADYKVLQAQVNPHFIHNILSVIGLMGYQKDSPEIMDMCSQLTRMLQYTTETGVTKVTIDQEIAHVSMYLKLMKYRYLDMLEYHIAIEPDMNEKNVPKFILQPVVENCFQHSFVNETKEKYIVSVNGKMTPDGWEITIEDNGCGFSRKKVRQLEKQFEEIKATIDQRSPLPDMQIGQMALINTYARLHIYTEGQIDIKLGNGSLGGSSVAIICRGGVN